MASHPAPGRPGLAQRFRQEYPADDWTLLTGLPRAVLIAATTSVAVAGRAALPGAGTDAAPAPIEHRRTVAEGLAGLEALAAGRFSDSDLVRAVVAAIYAETDERPVGGQPRVGVQPRVAHPAGDGGHRPVGEPRPVGVPVSAAPVLGQCRRATVALAARADPADSAAYRQWVQHVAARVCAERGSGFLIDLGVALGLR